MTDQERLIEQHMTILDLENKNLILRRARREALNFAQETAVRARNLGGDDPLGNLMSFLSETASRGLLLNESYRRLLDD